ncbi:hypothetical protein Drose_13535 [Dactylosporangium roseum]|uniref:Uncharacterized protein n=1 Tax=Dactylosporangium roseum TaxID=47989 RepID=A0ABY5ZET2_9ACTN|nr:hypothetical protein [Dactylosporangium roseum]UWZ39153.1 hypothetical protein Drose_13535 [Dactylosporangium roseum]
MLLKGMLLSFSDPVLGLVPTIVFCQYNPVEVTRTFTVTNPGGGGATAGGTAGAPARTAPLPAGEEYTLKLEFDATDGLETGGPLTTALGISPRLAALEMLMQPVGSSLLGGLVGDLLGAGKPKGHAIPVGRPPLVFFAWGPARITPVRVKSMVIRETAFDALLNPTHATVDVGLTVLRTADLPKDEKLARLAADYYRGAREVKSVLQLPQMLELGG